jgi:hypothetical protein
MNQQISVSPQAIMAKAVVNAKSRSVPLKIEEISRLFFDAEEKGVNLGQIALRKVPGGELYSEDAEAFVGRFLAAGYATARSPIDFSDEGIEICKRIIEKESQKNADNFTAALSLLGLDV